LSGIPDPNELAKIREILDAADRDERLEYGRIEKGDHFIIITSGKAGRILDIETVDKHGQPVFILSSPDPIEPLRFEPREKPSHKRTPLERFQQSQAARAGNIRKYRK